MANGNREVNGIRWVKPRNVSPDTAHRMPNRGVVAECGNGKMGKLDITQLSSSTANSSIVVLLK